MLGRMLAFHLKPSKMETQRTSFHDLPLEVRQMIYTNILPDDRTLNFPMTRQEDDVFAACGLIPENEEFEDFIYKECGVNITVDPAEKIGLPDGVEWHRFQWINITIDYYDTQNERPSLVGVRDLIHCLRTGRPQVLPPINIQFREDPEDHLYGDATWAVDVAARSVVRFRRVGLGWKGHYMWSRSEQAPAQDDQSSRYGLDVWLRTLNEKPQDPVAVSILDLFLELPRCISATIQPLHNLTPRRPNLPRYDPSSRIFYQDYIDDLCSALELWFTGHRETIPRDAFNHLCAKSELERLAYAWEDDHFYCDGVGEPR